MSMSFENPQIEFDQKHLESSERENKIFSDYLDHLGLSEDAMRDRDVIDIGAGSRMFSAHLLREGVTDRAYSLEPNIGVAFPEENEMLKNSLPAEMMAALDARTVRATMENIPFKDGSFDLVVGHGAVPGIEDQETLDGFDEIVRILREGGEARLYPIHREEGSWAAWRRKVEEKLAEYEAAGHEVRLEEGGSINFEDGKEVLYDRVIIRKAGERRN